MPAYKFWKNNNEILDAPNWDGALGRLFGAHPLRLGNGRSELGPPWRPSWRWVLLPARASKERELLVPLPRSGKVIPGILVKVMVVLLAWGAPCCVLGIALPDDSFLMAGLFLVAAAFVVLLLFLATRTRKESEKGWQR